MAIENLELSLGLPGSDSWSKKKRGFSEFEEVGNSSSSSSNGGKNQVIGWPPICSYRKSSFSGGKGSEISESFVKISMDGAPYLRKIDLNVYGGYSELSHALEKMFGCFDSGGYAGKESFGCSEYIPIYEDRDGDWMLVGDVPWGMFVESCRRLRIIKSSDMVGN